MRINVYAEEITDRVELVEKNGFTGVRFYLHLPVSLQTPPVQLGGAPGITQVQGPFVHHRNDDDSAAVTFWGKRELRKALEQAIAVLDEQEEGKRGVKVGVQIATIYPMLEQMADLFAQGPQIGPMNRRDFLQTLEKVIRLTGGKIQETAR